MRYLGIDWGLKRIGLAFSEGTLAQPLKTEKITGLSQGVKKIIEDVGKYQIDVIVLGKPEGQMGQAVKKVAQSLQKSGFKVVLADETLSSKEALKIMLETGVGKEARRSDNAVAAAIILQRYLDFLEEEK